MNNNSNIATKFGEPIEIPDDKFQQEKMNISWEDVFALSLQSDPDWGILDETDIERYVSIAPPGEQDKIRRMLMNEYQKQQTPNK